MTPHDSDDWDDAIDGLDALDFGASSFDDDSSGLDALPDYVATRGDHDAVHDYADDEAGEFDEGGLGAIDGAAVPDDQERIPAVQAINPPGTVVVTAYLNGSVAQVDLDPKVTMLTEAQLADEVRFVAGVAAKRATAVMHVGVVNMLVAQGMDFRDAQDFVATNLPYATPEQAGEAELALIARHSSQAG
ncbi:hypothetical protein [Mycobacterium sp. DBP42]|uniref:hypothetical protein n=1 Tax=Mycobacterium sp. DBP42 TaxID=2545267 RepID=UPI00110C9BF6|nr:hypothetical protein [Mycobacterium sp. DBP42]TMS51338.1 hypothetical protein E0T84_19780 [Mycobacterium sp. DBP42]